jgi:hypothetical protein
VKGEFEQRLKNVIDAVQQSPYRFCCLLMKRIPSSARAIRRVAQMRPPAETGAGAWRTAYHCGHHLV